MSFPYFVQISERMDNSEREKRAQHWSWVKPPVQTDLCSLTHRDGLDKSHPLSALLAPRVSHEGFVPSQNLGQSFVMIGKAH